MKMTKKLVKEIILELKDGVVREDLPSVEDMTDTALKNFEDVAMDEIKPNEKNDTVNYFMSKIMDEIEKRSEKKGNNNMKKVASNKAKKDEKEVNKDTKKGNKTVKNDTKKEDLKKEEAPKNDPKKTKEAPKEEAKVINLDEKIKELKMDDLEKKVTKAQPLAFSKLVANRDHILLLSSEYGMERVIVLDVDTDENGKEYALIKSLDNKATYDFIYKSKTVRGKKGTYTVKNNGGEEYNVIISLPQAI